LNIYINIEVAVRETQSKLLLAILAAVRGHEVLLSDLESLEKGIVRRYLVPGIFHTKSITPGKTKTERHNRICKNDSIITSIDEEGGLVNYGYDWMLNSRYSEAMVKQTSAIFTWGEDDYNSLTQKFKKYSHKIHLTGSPRSDLWKPLFSNYWKKKKIDNALQRPFLLVSSNMDICETIFFHTRIKNLEDAGYFERYPTTLEKQFKVRSNNFLKAFKFIEAIKYISKNNNNFDIVFRPHPIESVECWKILLSGIPNIHVNCDNDISYWVNNSFAVMHNGCTTGLETIISKKPLLTYVPPELDNEYYLSNKLGYLIDNKEDLLDKINSIFQNTFLTKNDYLQENYHPLIKKKIYIDANELAAKKIVKIWENLENKKLLKSNNWLKFKIYLFKMKISGIIAKVIKFKFGEIYKKDSTYHKFKEFNLKEIKNDISNLQKLLGVKTKLECKLLSKRTILIKKL
jgi:surface carbohydrate biosynthesis protein